MKYSIHYYRECPILDKADEIIIKYEEKDPELINFVDKWESNQRIVATITTLSNEEIEENLPIFEATAKKHNFAILLSRYQPYKIFLEKGINFFFIEGAYCLDELIWQHEQGVSDIYIINELGFYLEDISNSYEDINIRVYPNLAQPKYKNNLNSFFIRPDDVKSYEGIVDIFEFQSGLRQQSTLYKIYNDEEWSGKLDLIIFGLSLDIDNSTILPDFGKLRTNCKKKCAFNKCHLCDKVILNYSKYLQKDNLKIIKEENDLN